MLTKLKLLPTTVKLSLMFLTAMIALGLVIFPSGMIVLLAAFFATVSVARLFLYWAEGQ